MSEIPMGTIDPERIGCTTEACIIFTKHAKGRSVPQIARDLYMTEDYVRNAIAGVWRDDKHSAHHTRVVRRTEVGE